ncbi:MAG: hypothetical protein KDA52_05480 [Planctomycetaceae bacterium]|nr:hypothetical protein [Planctomycetaceae bacterium]
MSLFNKLFAPAKPKGMIGYLGLSDWWLESLSDDERAKLQERFTPFGLSAQLTNGTIIETNETAAGLLISLAGYCRLPDEWTTEKRILMKAEELAIGSGNVLDLHFVHSAGVQSAYKCRDKISDALQDAIIACERQVDLAPRAANAFKRKYRNAPLPSHKGFEQLAIIREKQQDFVEAMRLSKLAQKQGWSGSWGRRISRLQKRLDKLNQKSKSDRGGN